MEERDLLLETDPDVIIGYNTTNFDLPYLIERARAAAPADPCPTGRRRRMPRRRRLFGPRQTVTAAGRGGAALPGDGLAH